MLDFSEVDRFARRLDHASRSGFDNDWESDWSRETAEEMRARAPRRTGRLAASIQAQSEGVSVGAPYAAFVEYGTARTAPQPYVRPSLNSIRPRAVRDAGDRAIREI